MMARTSAQRSCMTRIAAKRTECSSPTSRPKYYRWKMSLEKKDTVWNDLEGFGRNFCAFLEAVGGTQATQGSRREKESGEKLMAEPRREGAIN